MEDVMSIDWAERVRRLAIECDQRTAGHQLIRRMNFDLFIAVEEVANWQEFQKIFTIESENMDCRRTRCPHRFP
jgi:hypothetical protein